MRPLYIDARHANSARERASWIGDVTFLGQLQTTFQTAFAAENWSACNQVPTDPNSCTGSRYNLDNPSITEPCSIYRM